MRCTCSLSATYLARSASLCWSASKLCSVELLSCRVGSGGVGEFDKAPAGMMLVPGRFAWPVEDAVVKPVVPNHGRDLLPARPEMEATEVDRSVVMRLIARRKISVGCHLDVDDS